MFANKFGRFPHCECGLVVVIKREEKEEIVPVPLTSSKVDLTIFDAFAEVRVTQVYANKETSPIEAEYIFPLDDKAAVFEFEAEIEGRRVVGTVKEKEQAKQEYQDAIQHGQTAAMLEKKKPDIFKASIGCLKPGAKAVVRISYIAELLIDGDHLRFVLPTTVAPRYVPATDTDETAKELGSMLYSSSSPCQMLIKGRVVAKTKIAELTSPSHKIDVSLNPQDVSPLPGTHSATVELSGITTDMDRDFILLVKVEEPHQPRVFVEVNKDSVAAMLTLVPSFKLKDEKVEIIFLIDRSGSMMGEKVEMAKNALKLFLKSLPSDCYFNILGFGSTYAALFPNGSLKYDGESLAQAVNYANVLHADMGGTEIVAPLQYIYSLKKQDGYKRQVIVLTDGEVSNVEQVMELVKNNNKESRTFALGIGSDVSHGLVRGIARMGHGTSLFCSLDERLETKVQQQLANCLQPALQDVAIKWGSLSDAAKNLSDGKSGDAGLIEKTRTLLGFGKPKKSDSNPSASESKSPSADNSGIAMMPYLVPPIFDGSRFTQFCVFSKALLPCEGETEGLEKALGQVLIKATAPDGPLDVALDINPKDVMTGSTIHRLAVKTRIQDLEEGVSDIHENAPKPIPYEQMEAFNKTVKDTLIAVSTKYNIVCRETAFIAVDSEAKRENQEIVLKKRRVASQVPHGYGGFGGGAAFYSAAPLANRSMMCRGGGGMMAMASMPMAMPMAMPMMAKRAAGVQPAFGFCATPDMMNDACVSDLMEAEASDVSMPAGSSQFQDIPQSSGRSARALAEEKESHPGEWDEEEKLRRLVDLQEFDGCFPLDGHLANLLGTTVDALTAAAKEMNLEAHVKIWATALAIAFMNVVLADLQEDWQLMCDKAKQGLSGQLAKDGGVMIGLDAVIAAATKHVESLSKK